MNARFYLSPPPWPQSSSRYICVEGRLFGKAVKTISLSMDGKPLMTWEHDPAHAGPVRLVAPISPSAKGSVKCECALSISPAYVPSREIPGSGDERALGMLVKKMGIITSPNEQLPKVKPDARAMTRFYINELYKRAIRLDRKHTGNWLSIYNFRKTLKALSRMTGDSAQHERSDP